MKNKKTKIKESHSKAQEPQKTEIQKNHNTLTALEETWTCNEKQKTKIKEPHAKAQGKQKTEIQKNDNILTALEETWTCSEKQ